MTGYARDSRYRSQMAIARRDPAGRTVLSTDLRPRPSVAGSFHHTIEDCERLEHLAYRYYRKPRKWWRICDANPQFQSPLAMIGAEPIEMVRIATSAGAPTPPWSAMLAALRRLVGVDDVSFALEERQLEAPGWTSGWRRSSSTAST